MVDRHLPAGTTPTAGADYMDDSRGENAALWVRSRDKLTNVAGTNSITADTTIGPISAYSEPLRFLLVPPNTNTGPVNIDVDGVGVVDLLDADGNALTAGALVGLRAYPIDFVGGDFRILTAVGGVSAASTVLVVANRQADGVAGGTATSGSYLTYPLNTSVQNDISGASLAANQIVLPAGTYDFMAVAPFFDTGRARLRLRNITAGATIAAAGPTIDANTADATQTLAMVFGRFTLAASATLELQYRVQTTNAADGLGLAATFAETEQYGAIKITKVPT